MVCSDFPHDGFLQLRMDISSFSFPFSHSKNFNVHFYFVKFCNSDHPKASLLFTGYKHTIMLIFLLLFLLTFLHHFFPHLFLHFFLLLFFLLFFLPSFPPSPSVSNTSSSPSFSFLLLFLLPSLTQPQSLASFHMWHSVALGDSHHLKAPFALYRL